VHAQRTGRRHRRPDRYFPSEDAASLHASDPTRIWSDRKQANAFGVTVTSARIWR
jgi:hypothetical protein